MNKLCLLFCLGLLVHPLNAQQQTGSPRQVPLAPQASLQQIELEPGFTAHMLAHEPQAIDPVEVVFDDAGRMWVVEMSDYPFRVVAQPQGRIRVLSDLDGDGQFETAHTFADQLEMPTGIALWKQGVVATVAGKLIYLSDTDGDLKADVTQVWLEGFTEDNEQLRANHPRLGPDGWWYIACGLRGGKVQLGPELRGEPAPPPLEIGSRDVRFDARTNTIELVTGPAQFGLTFDRWGHRLFCSNRNPATQVIFEQSDLIDNPLAGLAPSTVDVIPAGDASRVYPLVDAWTTSHLHSGQFTAACGVFARNSSNQQTEVFACEPTASLVRRQISLLDGVRLVPESNDTRSAEVADATLATSPPPAPREWLASRDAWFRPVNLTLAPDGEMIVVDMHRAVIEHPNWVPDELKHRPDERWGDQAGRIVWVGRQWRLPEQLRALRAAPLATRTDGELVRLVASDNLWQQETAARLLQEREATAAIPDLKNIWEDATQRSAARVAALRLAVRLTRIERQQATPLSVSQLLGSDRSATEQRDLITVLLRASREEPTVISIHPDELLDIATTAADRGVRFEAWLGLGARAADPNWQPSQATFEGVARAWIDDGDGYLFMAAGSGLRKQPRQLLQCWLRAVSQARELARGAEIQLVPIAQALAAASLRRGDDFAEVAQQALQLVAVTDDAPPTSGAVAAQLAALVCLQNAVKQPEFQSLLGDADWSHLIAEFENEYRPLENRVAAIALLGQTLPPESQERLRSLVVRNTAPELAGPLLEAWCAVSKTAPDAYLMDQLGSAVPQLQRVILSLIAGSPQRLEMLAQRLESGKLDSRQIGASELEKLVTQAVGDTKLRLQSQLDQIRNSNRAQVIAEYKDCLTWEANVERGIEVFRKHCASCHRIGEIGVQVGPNISDSRVKQPLELLTAILDPNLAIDNNYFRFVVITEEGRVVEGIIAEETADAIVIRSQDDRRERIRRDDIVEMKATGVSLMPEGVESQIDPQAMADLIAFVKGWRYLDGAIPGR